MMDAATKVLPLLAFPLLLIACSSSPPCYWSPGDTTSKMEPNHFFCVPPAKRPSMAKGVAQRLTAPGTRLIVWDANENRFDRKEPEAVQAAILWLLQHDLVIIERSQIERVLREQNLVLRHGSDESLLRVGKLLDAKEIVFVSGDKTYAHLRSVDTETGQVVWSGSAKDPNSELHVTYWHLDATYALVAQALEAVWGSAAARRDGVAGRL